VLADAFRKTQDANDLLSRSPMNPKQKVLLKELDSHLKGAGKILRKLMESL
jgi:hypothetical protein